MATKKHKWYPDKLEGEKLQEFLTWLNCWANLRKHPERLNKEGKINKFYRGYQQAVHDIMRKFDVNWILNKKDRSENEKGSNI